MQLKVPDLSRLADEKIGVISELAVQQRIIFSSRVSGSQKAQETLAPFSLSGAAFLPMDGAAFQTQGYHHAQSQHDEGAGKGSAPLASARPGADQGGDGPALHRRGQRRQ